MTLVRYQSWPHYLFYAMFGTGSLVLLFYYLSSTIIYFTTPYQFPVKSLTEMPLTLLIFPAEVFSLLFAVYFVYTLLTDRAIQQPLGKLRNKKQTPIAILLPIYNEPKKIVERTLKAALTLEWSAPVTIYLLDDSTTHEHKANTEELAVKYGGPLRQLTGGALEAGESIRIVRRNDRTGYKAGNINHAIKNHVTEEYFVIFDADQAPSKDFLVHTMDFFSDRQVGFVQTPQYFLNDSTPLERSAKVGANIFFQSQTISKAKDGAMPFCGTNVVVRTGAFRTVNGFSYYTSTEDIDLGIRLNDAGYYGVYVPRVLAKGYAPKDFKSYASQQYRWANGNLAILRENWLRILRSKTPLRYQIHTFFTLGWWLIGIVSFIFVIVPIISLLTGLGTHHTWLPEALIAVLYINVVLGILMIYTSLHGRIEHDKVRFSDALLEYSLITNSMFIYMKAAFNALFKRYVGFVRTNKNGGATGLKPIAWNLIFAALCFGLSIYSLYYGMRASDIITVRTYVPVSLWLLFYSLVLTSSLLFVQVKTQPSSSKPSPSTT